MTHPKFESAISGLRNWLIKFRLPGKAVFLTMGILSTIWFLIRVIPKPQRAGYPCMKAAFPFMSAFVVWILSITGSIAALKKARRNIKAQRYLVAFSFGLAALAFSAIAIFNYNRKAEAADNYVDNSTFEANEPIGEGKGIHPGRVVWVHNKNATNENGGTSKSNAFFLPENNDQSVIQKMLDDAILKLSGEKALSDAWEGIFKDFNKRKHGISKGYQSGEIIFIKINEGTSSWAANDDLSPKTWYNPSAESTPFSLHALLTHLVNIAGVAQSDIYIGDPRSHVWKHTYDYLKNDFPNIKFADKDPAKEVYGRTTITETGEPVIFYSDKGAVMKNAVHDKLFIEMAEANYLINLAALKAHARAGITFTAKNHFGSHAREDAMHLHPSLVAPENDTPINTGDYPTVGYNKYRVFVDLMGHEMLGGNTLLFFIDGLWGGPEATQPPSRFTSSPFDNDWSNSLILSLDPVALESVCFDILRYEFNNPNDPEEYRPHMYGADDYLQQAADPANWPEGIIYDPENDGTPLTSLGVHEHWNNFMSKQYSRNLGIPGGIELITIPENLAPYNPFVARMVETPPSIDGDGSDPQWQNSPWYPINHTWINYGEEIPEEDFTGEFKVLWSETDNALHYLVRIRDDVFVDNYQFPDDGYYNYDIVEVFIDEDRSGGKHIFDAGSENAENAFSYHIAANAPADGDVTSTMLALDIAGTGWSNKITADYAGHFPAFAMKRNGNEYIYEFTLGVYSDLYDPSDKEASRVTLATGKIMGMTLAYCDNDTPGTNRDNFFGSVWVTQEAYNDHWELADDYGKLALADAAGNVPAPVYVNNPPVTVGSVDNYTIKIPGANETLIRNYSLLFSDPDNDPLTYNLSSSNDLVHVFFYGNLVQIRADASFSGTAIITLTASDGEYDESISIEVSYSNVSVDLNTLVKTIKCFPNPVTSGIMTVSFSDPGNGDVYLSVLNLNGQVIKTVSKVKSYQNFESRLDLGDINKGLYLLEIKFNGKRAVVRFTK